MEKEVLKRLSSHDVEHVGWNG